MDKLRATAGQRNCSLGVAQMSSGETQIPDSSENDSNASGGIWRQSSRMPSGETSHSNSVSSSYYGAVGWSRWPCRDRAGQKLHGTTGSEDTKTPPHRKLTSCHSGSTETGYRPSSSLPTTSGPVVIPMTSISNSTIGKPLCPQMLPTSIWLNAMPPNRKLSPAHLTHRC